MYIYCNVYYLWWYFIKLGLLIVTVQEGQESNSID